MAYSSLLTWWIVSISWSALFLIAVSFFLYWKSRVHHTGFSGMLGVVKDFVFVWVLAALLILYIVTINNSSSLLFVAGNIVVEIVLIFYTVKNRGKRSLRSA